MARIGNHFTVFPNRPLYLEVQFFAPHDPAHPRGRATSAPSRSALLPKDKAFNEKNSREKPRGCAPSSASAAGSISKVQTRYRNRLETLLAVDEAVEAIVSELEAEGVLGETYVIFTSDNGYMQGQHRLHQGKFVAYDPSSKVPLLIRGPGIPAGG